MFTRDSTAENKIFSSGRSQFFKKKKKRVSFRFIAKLENCAHPLSSLEIDLLASWGRQSRYLFLSQLLTQLGTMSSSSIPLISTDLVQKRTFFSQKLELYLVV